jgi:nucleotide-binding universal stress UspA family protein
MVLLSPETWPTLADEEDKRVRTCFKQLEKQLQDPPRSAHAERQGRSALAQVIEERRIDLLVLGTHGRAGVGKLFLGSVAEELFGARRVRL